MMPKQMDSCEFPCLRGTLEMNLCEAAQGPSSSTVQPFDLYPITESIRITIARVEEYNTTSIYSI